MRIPVSERKKKLMEIYDPYVIIGKNGTELKKDAPEEAKKAFAEFKKIAEEEWKHYLDPHWF